MASEKFAPRCGRMTGNPSVAGLWFTFARLSNAYLHELVLALFLQRDHHSSLPQQLGGGLRPAPESRSRGTFPHLSRSLFTRLFSSY